MSAARPGTAAEALALKDGLVRVLGAAHVSDDADDRAYFSRDIAAGGAVAALVAAPGTIDELREVVRVAARAGFALVSRGAGHSYTQGYVPAHPRCVLIDLRRLDRVVEINVADRYVVAEAGCTWAALYDALAAKGVRTPFFGPLSGIVATLGGTLSQNAAFFGSGTHGSAAESVLGLEVVLADGTLMATNCARFLRYAGPDLTGMFLGDAGAFGIKARIVLTLIDLPAAQGFASFAFDQPQDMIAAQIAIARLGVASECYGFDPVANRHLSEQGFKLSEGAGMLGEVARAAGGGLAGAREVLRVATAGRKPTRDIAYSLHVIVEDRAPGVVDERLAQIREIAAAAGTETANTIPKVTRAKPFRRIRALLGPSGQNWLPVHGLFPLSRAAGVMSRAQALLGRHAAEFAQHRIEASFLSTTVGAAFLLEPQFFWYDRLSAFHLRHALPEQQERYASRPADPAARAAVFRARDAMRDLFAAEGAAHLQLGKYYPFAEKLDPSAAAAIQAFKRQVDPSGLMNPGALGLS